MESFSTDTEPGVESELVDLGGVPLTVLRALDDTALHRAVRHVVDQSGSRSLSTASSCSP
jgi:FXSXX-COOH protein